MTYSSRIRIPQPSFLRRLALVLLAVSVLSPYAIQAQLAKPDRISVSGNAGFLVAHRPALKGLANTHSLGTTVDLEWFTDGSKRWHWLYRRPVCGVQIQYLSLGEPDLLGHQVSIVPKAAFPISSIYKRLEHRLYGGGGLGYSSKVWDLNENLRTLVISTHLNAVLIVGYEGQWEWKEKLGIHYGVQLSHQSNGGFSMPNLGTNTFTVFAGLMFSKVEKPALEAEAIFPAYLPPTWNQSISLSYGLKEKLPPEGDKYNVIVLSHSIIRRGNWKTGVILRNDLYWDQGVPALAEDASSKTLPEVQYGLALGMAKYYGRLSWELMMGAYLYAPLNEKGPIYHRFIGRWVMTDKLDVHVGLRTHWAKADHPEIGIHYRFNGTRARIIP